MAIADANAVLISRPTQTQLCMTPASASNYVTNLGKRSAHRSGSNCFSMSSTVIMVATIIVTVTVTVTVIVGTTKKPSNRGKLSGIDSPSQFMSLC